MTNTTTEPSQDLTRLEILRAYKKHMCRDAVNVSPFTEDRVVRYDTDVGARDVPDIHREVRQLIAQAVQGIHQGLPSQVVILAGNPGMGKSHLINYFRPPERAEELGYVLVCNSNHWRADEFEECLLDWTLTALVSPSPNKPHLLLQRVQDLAFQALGQILSQPGQIARFNRNDASGLVRRIVSRLTGQGYGRFQQMIQARDPGVFRLLDFPGFAGYVCDRFLRDGSNPFHRYVLHVLLRYLFPEDRELVLHWLRRKEVRKDFLRKLGVLDRIDRNYKVLDTIKILISLFTPEVSRNLSDPGGAAARDLVFFFAFDQMEGRQELFEKEEDWLKFFAQLSELYNSLPNVFILFTMTLNLRNRLYARMEKQFQDRIKRDQRFLLHDIPDDEVLALYRKRVAGWLGEALPEVRAKVTEPDYRFLPFTQEDVLGLSRRKTLRETLETLDEQFRNRLSDVTIRDPFYEYLVTRNEVRRKEDETGIFQYTGNHLDLVQKLFELAGGWITGRAGILFAGADWKKTEDQVPALRLEFRGPDGRWVRVFLARLPFPYKALLPGCLGLLYHLQTDRNFLWLIRPNHIDAEVEKQKPGQCFARELPVSVHTSLQAILRLLAKKDEYPADAWAKAEDLIYEEIKKTYLGELLQQAREAIGRLQNGQGGEDESQQAAGQDAPVATADAK